MKLKMISIAAFLGFFLVAQSQAQDYSYIEQKSGGCNLLYFEGGSYEPEGDFDDADPEFDSGPNLGIRFASFPSPYAGFEIGLNRTSNERDYSIYDVDEYVDVDIDIDEEFVTFGLEALFIAKYDIGRFQPYLGFGIGLFHSEYEIKFSADGMSDEISADGTDMGQVLKIGARFFVSQSFFIGVNLKKYWLEMDLEFDEDDFDEEFELEIDGHSYNFEIGFAF